MGVKCAWGQARATVGGGTGTGCLDGWVPAPRLPGAASWRFGSEWANTPSLYSPPAFPYSRIHPRRSPPQSLEAEGSPGVCVVLSPPHFPVFPWTCLSLSSKQNSGRAPSLPSCPFLGFGPTCRHGTGGSVVQPASPDGVDTGRSWPSCMQADSDPCCSASNALW